MNQQINIKSLVDLAISELEEYSDLNINSYFDFVVPKFLMISIVNILRFFNKDFPVNKEIIEGLSITTKIKSNVFKDFKNFSFRNINNYLIDISK